MCCGRRYVVVILCFIGLLLSIGSREVFSIVVTHVIQNGNGSHPHSGEHSVTNVIQDSSTSDGNCIPHDDPRNLQQPWPPGDVFLFQTVYFIGYILTQLPGGILAAKFSPRSVFGSCILLTSVLTIAMRFAMQYQAWLVFLIRFMQGFIEGPSIPALNGVLSKWALKSEKTIFVTVSYSGAYLSAAVASYSTGTLICYVSWGSALFIYGGLGVVCALVWLVSVDDSAATCRGGLGVVWALVWLVFVDDSPATCRGMSEEERERFRQENRHATHAHVNRPVPWKSILTSVPLSAIFVAAVCRNWIFTLLLTQIPKYYKDVYHMNAQQYGRWSSLPHVCMTVVVISCGITVDKLIKKQVVSTTFARKAAETIGFGVEASCIMALGFIHDQNTAIALLCVGVGVSGIAISGYQANPLDLAPQYVSVMTGVIRLGTIASVLSTVVAERYPARFHSVESWQTVFIIAASIHFFGIVYYLIFASGERQPWAIEADLERSVIVPAPQSMPQYGACQQNGSAGHVDAVGESGEEEEERRESLFSKSLHVEGLSYSDDEEDNTPTWMLSTI